MRYCPEYGIVILPTYSTYDIAQDRLAGVFYHALEFISSITHRCEVPGAWPQSRPRQSAHAPHQPA